jgi:hypothetical protein
MTDDDWVSPDDEEINYVLENVDPKYHDVLRRALTGLCDWYGDKSHRQVDDWFTIVYGMLMELEDVLECKREHVKQPLPFDISEITAKPRINKDDITPSRDSWTDQYDL